MTKKNKSKKNNSNKPSSTASTDDGICPPSGTPAGGQQQRDPQQPRGPQQERPQQSGGPEQQRPQQQGGPQQQWRQQQGGSQQQRPQQQGGPQQERPQQSGGPEQQRPQQQGGPQQQWRQQQGGSQQQRPQQQGGPQQQWRQQQGGSQQQRRQQQGGPQQQWGQQQGGSQQQRRQQQGGPQQPKPQQQGGPQQQRPQQQGGPQQPKPQQPRGPEQERPQQQGGSQQQRPQQQGGPQQQWRQQQGGAQQQRPQQQGLQHQRHSTSTSSSSSVVSVSSGNIPRGTLGRRGTVEVNYLDIFLDNLPMTAYHYDVQITPDRPKKFLRPAFEQFNRQYFPMIEMAFDGKCSFYTVEMLNVPQCEKDVQIEDTNSRTISFKIAVKETQDIEIDLNSLRSYLRNRIYDKPMRALQCIEVVLSNACHTKGVRVGRSFFVKPKEVYDLFDGYEMWTGLFQAAILGDRPFLNVDISHKSFPSECSLITFLQNKPLNKPLERGDLYMLKGFLRDLNIIYEPPGCFNSFPRMYKVNDITTLSAADLNFKLDDGTTTSIQKYFLSKGYKLLYPNLNCLHVGSTVKNNFIPLELCKIPPGQVTNKKDGSTQVTQMIKFAATSTNVRKDKIMRMLEYFHHNDDKKMLAFGIQIGKVFLEVPMRILQSPMIEYFGGDIISPFKGVWRMNDNTRFLLTGNTVYTWAVIYSNYSRINYDKIQSFIQLVSKLSKKMHMSLAEKPQVAKFDKVEVTLQKLRSEKTHLVFVVLPRKPDNFYATVKQSAELKLGQLTQCIKEYTIEKRCDVQTIQNILLKVNHKLNGTNHIISKKTQISLNNVMFMGADVTHPSPDQKFIPSVVGVVASHDTNGACYNMQYRLQKGSVENIEDMASIFEYHIKMYKKYQTKYPDHIIYYRDGVSDGQFPIVKQNELRDIRAVCSKLGCKPKITCIIVIKRHHTRFFPKTVNPRDKFNNVEPGTVVDQVIVHPNEIQFFMVSHQSIQGTAKPTRYNVIEDDAKMNIDDLQALTYHLCHMFPRCNRAVSYPAPAYLAHLVAFRGRVYIDGVQKFFDLNKEYQKHLINTEFMVTNPMYFI